MRVIIGYDKGIDDYSCKTYMLRMFGKTFVFWQRLFKEEE